MRSSIHYLRQSVIPRSDRWLSKSGNVRTCTGLRPQIDSHEASKGLLMNHKVNSNELSCSPPCFVCHIKRRTKFTKSKFRYQKLTEIEFSGNWIITEIRLISALRHVNTEAANQPRCVVVVLLPSSYRAERQSQSSSKPNAGGICWRAKSAYVTFDF